MAENGGKLLKTDYIDKEILRLLYTALMPENRLALQIAEKTGLRINDVLSLKTEQIKKQRFTIKEEKTKKRKQVYLPTGLWLTALGMSGIIYVFEGRTSYKKHRTRQAVFKDLKRVAKLYRLEGAKIKQNIAPHSTRKVYAVEMRKNGKSLKEIRRKLNHSDDMVTMIYAFADEIKKRGKNK